MREPAPGFHAQALHHRLAAQVCGHGETDYIVQPEHVSRMLNQRQPHLGNIAPAPVLFRQDPADFDAAMIIRIGKSKAKSVQANPAEHLVIALSHQRQEAKAVSSVPFVAGLKNRTGLHAAQGAGKVLADDWVAKDRRHGVQVGLQIPRAKQQSVGFQPHRRQPIKPGSPQSG